MKTKLIYLMSIIFSLGIYNCDEADGGSYQSSTDLDAESPVITLLGDNPLELNYGDVYTDPGATATDNYDGDLTASIVVGGDTVDTSVGGSYTVTYDVSDSAGNAATTVTRDVDVTINASTFTSIQDLRNSLKPDPHVETVDPSASFSILGPDGTTITCTGNSILDGSGNTVSDHVIISLYEFNTLDEMILAKAPTTSNGDLLVTGGSFEVTAENVTTGEELEFSSWGCNCSLNIQTNPSPTHESQMVLFDGNTNNVDNNGLEVVDWNQANADGGAGQGVFTAYGIDIGFSNCDVLYDMAGENGTQFEATVTGVTDYSSNVEVWLIIDDFPSVVMLTTVNSTPALETYAGSIPTGLNGTLVGIHIDDDSYLNFGVLPITVAGDDSFNIDVDYGTEAELVALVESLVN